MDEAIGYICVFEKFCISEKNKINDKNTYFVKRQ